MNLSQYSIEMEEIINNMPSVMSSKVIFDDQNEIEEIHVLASNERNAKQISRDIQSALVAKFDLRIDYKKISVAQVGFKHEVEGDRRLQINYIGHSIIGNMAEVKVALQKGEQWAEKVGTGINARNNVYRLIANTTLECVNALLENQCNYVMEDIEIIHLAKYRVVTIAIASIYGDGEEILIGSAIIKKDEPEAVVRATLDAINRKIAKLIH